MSGNVESFLNKFHLPFLKLFQSNEWEKTKVSKRSESLERLYEKAEQSSLTAVTETPINEGDVSEICISAALIKPRDADVKKTWVSLFNKGDKPMNINGWRLVDGSQKTRVIIDMVIEPGKTKVINNITPLNLKGKANEIKLFSKQSVMVDQVSYTANMLKNDEPVNFIQKR